MDILVNRNNLLDRNYFPDNLIEINNAYYHPFVEGYKLRVIDFVYKAFTLMAKEAKKEGYELYIDSGFRGYDYQESVLKHYLNILDKEAYKKVALPGTSEHQTGLAIDCATVIDGNYIDELTEEMPITKWLHRNCAKYGFILRYPKGKEKITGYNYEPWHIRFVGLELSEYLTNNNLTLEEYHLNKEQTR